MAKILKTNSFKTDVTETNKQTKISDIEFWGKCTTLIKCLLYRAVDKVLRSVQNLLERLVALSTCPCQALPMLWCSQHESWWGTVRTSFFPL